MSLIKQSSFLDEFALIPEDMKSKRDIEFFKCPTRVTIDASPEYCMMGDGSDKVISNETRLTIESIEARMNVVESLRCNNRKVKLIGRSISCNTHVMWDEYSIPRPSKGQRGSAKDCINHSFDLVSQCLKLQVGNYNNLMGGLWGPIGGVSDNVSETMVPVGWIPIVTNSPEWSWECGALCFNGTICKIICWPWSQPLSFAVELLGGSIDVSVVGLDANLEFCGPEGSFTGGGPISGGTFEDPLVHSATGDDAYVPGEGCCFVKVFINSLAPNTYIRYPSVLTGGPITPSPY